jgi:hypothetical protein
MGTAYIVEHDNGDHSRKKENMKEKHEREDGQHEAGAVKAWKIRGVLTKARRKRQFFSQSEHVFVYPITPYNIVDLWV